MLFRSGRGHHEAIRAFADRFHARSGGAIFSSRRIDGVEKIKKIALPTSDLPEDPPLNFPWDFKERYLLTIVVEKKNGFGILYMKYDYL